MGNGTLPTPTNSSRIHPPYTDSSDSKDEKMPTNTPENKSVVGTSPQKEVPVTFGTHVNPTVSFKNAVAQNAQKKEDKSPNNSDLPVPTSVKFGSINASLPMRVQSAPPTLDKSPSASDGAQLEVTPEGAATNFVRPSAAQSSFSVENARPFVPQQFQPPQAYRGYPPTSYVPQYHHYGSYRPHYGYQPRPYHPQGAYYPPPPVQNVQQGEENFRAPYQGSSQSGDVAVLNASAPVPSGSVATAASTAVVPPVRKKIVIVNPETGEEVDIKPIVKPATAKIETSTASLNPTIKAETKPVEVEAKPVIPPTLTPSAPVPVVQSPRKPVVMVDPRNNQTVDLASLTTTKTEKLEEIFAEIDEDDIFDSGMSDLEEDDEGEEKEQAELDEGITFPVIMTRKLKVTYPEGAIAFTFPPEDEPMRYSSEFMLQFADCCRGEATDIKLIPFPTEQHLDRPRRTAGRSGRAGGRSGRPRAPTEYIPLTNRAEDAWKRAGALVMDEDLALLRDVKQILNKLTEKNFERLTEQILALGVVKDAVMTGVIDMLFDKAVEEPRYAPLYARLCTCITKREVDEKAKEADAAAAAAAAASEGTSETDTTRAAPMMATAGNSIFRRCLVTKCEMEYLAKRAYSKQRLERLMAKELQEQGHDEQAAKEEAAEAAAPARTVISGELTEEDYVLIKTKRRVLGNMRFIGELYVAGLIPAKIMHTVIQELLGDIHNPEEEEVESVCRLIPTIGAMLDTAVSAHFWTKYIERLKVLSTNEKLSTRVRFMVQDVLELREHGWKKVKAPSAPLPAPPTNRRGGERDRRDSRDFREPRDARGGRFRGDAQSMDVRNQDVRSQDVRSQETSSKFERVGPAPRIQIRGRSDEPLPRPPSAASRGSQESINRYQALNEEEGTVPSPSPSPTGSDSVADEKTLGRICATLDEALAQKNYSDVTALFEELPLAGRAAALKTLVLHTMDKGRKHVNVLVGDVLPLASEGLLPSVVVDAGLRGAFENIDDLVVDIPSAYEFAGIVAAFFIDAHRLTLAALVESVLGNVLERDTISVGKVCLYTLQATKQDKTTLVKESHEALSKCVFLAENKDRLEPMAAKLDLADIFQQ